MAKRKRLSPANPDVFGAAPETKGLMTRAPIADVASEAATTAALDEVTRELAEARDGGRMVLTLKLDQIALNHLVRDRVANDEPEFQALLDSMSARGQQNPIEVVETAPGRYGLISGWRRCQALLHLTEAGSHNGTVLALLRKPQDASDAYLAMVEENEIRVGLSYFERARIAAKSVEQGVFDTEKAALLALFRAASRPKRSKIRSFLPLVAAFDGHLRFPHHLSERLGLRLAAAIEADASLIETIRDALTRSAPETPEAEASLITALLSATAEKLSLKAETETKSAILHQKLRDTLEASWHRDGGSLTLTGPAVTDEMREKLFAYLKVNLRD